MSTPTFLDPATLPFPFCPGCGHGTVLEKLDQALVERGTDPRNLVIVTDIGCSGLSDNYFATNTFHGLHGRSVTYATGLKLAKPELEVVVLMGDGGCGIGGHHLINAARRNIGVTVVVFNNMNYGMTGGEHSVSTPPGSLTPTTPHGQLERPMDICSTVAVNGASFVARTSTFEADLAETLGQAMDNDGFSLVDVWELCTAYFAPANRFNRGAMRKVQEDWGMPGGVLVSEARPEYASAYRESTWTSSKPAPAVSGPAPVPGPETALAQTGATGIPGTFEHRLERPLKILIAGAAGKKTVSAAGTLAEAAIRSGLHATQRNDYPVTVKTGHVVSEVILSPREILYSGFDSPDIAVVLFPEGLKKVRPTLEAMGPDGVIYIEESLAPEGNLPFATEARVVRIDPAGLPGLERRKELWAMAALGRLLEDHPFLSRESVEAGLVGDGPVAGQRREALRAGAATGS